MTATTTAPAARFDPVKERQPAATVLQKAVADGEVGHAFLLVGPTDVGQGELVAALAAALNCPDARDGQGCGTCNTCERIAGGRHPSVVAFEPPGAWYLVDNVREEWLPVASRTLAEGRRRVIWIREAERMNEATQNAFLKVLEEPGPSTVWVLDTADPDPLLDTILSRCRRVDVRLWEPRHLEGLADELGFDEHLRRVLARAAQGSPTRLAEYAQRECPACGSVYGGTLGDDPSGLPVRCENRRCPSRKPKGSEPAMLERDPARERHLSVIRRLAEEGPVAVSAIAADVDAWAKARPGALLARHAQEREDAITDSGEERWSDVPSPLRRRLDQRHKRKERRARLLAFDRFLDEFGTWLRDVVAVASGADPATQVVNVDHADQLRRDAEALPVAAALEALALVPPVREALVVHSAQPQLQLERLLLPVAVAIWANG